MKIKVLYENTATTLEVSEEDFTLMDKITTPEGQKIHCGERHFKALDSGVVFSKSPVKNWMEFKKEI